MTEYTPHLRPRHRQRYWYLANGEVLREPRLLSTPAERRFEIEGEGQSFWSSDLNSHLDEWAERQAKDRSTGVMVVLTNRTGKEGTDWVHDAFMKMVDSQTGTISHPTSYEYKANIDAKVTFADGPDAVVFTSNLKGRRYGKSDYTVTNRCFRARPQRHRLVVSENGHEYSGMVQGENLEPFEVEELLGEPWVETKSFAPNEYVAAAAHFCRSIMQVADFVTIGDGMTIHEAKWDPAYVTSLQAAMSNEEPIERFKEHLEGARRALMDMGFDVGPAKETDVWSLTHGMTPVLLKVTDKSESPWTSFVIDFPTGRIFAGKNDMKADALTLYEMAVAKAERNGNADELRAALAIMAGDKAFQDHEIARQAVRTARKILPVPTN